MVLFRAQIVGVGTVVEFKLQRKKKNVKAGVLIKPITSSKIKISIHIKQCGLSICFVFFGPKKEKKTCVVTEPNSDFYFA